MIDKTDAYKAAIIGDARRIYLQAVIDLISPDITYGAVTDQSESAYSKNTQIYDKDFSEPKKYATCEPGRWTLDGSFDIYPDDAEEVTEGMGYQSAAVSGSDGSFATAQCVKLTFSNVSVLQACSVWFPDNDYDGVPEDFTIEVQQGGTVYYTKAVTGNGAASVSFDGFTVNNPDAIKLTVTKMSKPYRRLRVIEIVPGIYEKWTEDIVYQLKITQQVNFACTTLPYGTCTLRMNNKSRRFEPRSKSGLFQSIEERQPIPISLGVLLADDSVDLTPAGVYYQKSGGWKTGDNSLTMEWDLVDIVGLLADRSYEVPDTLPTTLAGWISELVAQLGDNFAGCYSIDSNYASTSVTVNQSSDIEDMTCGDILRYVCMAAGCFPRADSETGYLAIEPLWKAGNYITLDNLEKYPAMKANDDIALVTFKLYESTSTISTYNVSGNTTASSQSVSVNNPFIHTSAQAITAAKNILAMYGGNVIELTGRGDMSCECGDVDSVQLDSSTATAARRYKQELGFNDGVMKNLSSSLLQASGGYLYSNCEVITASGTWTAPSGVTSLRIVIVGGGDGGTDGEDGDWDEAGADGDDGLGGKIYSATIAINDGQSFTVSIGSGGAASGGSGTATTFGSYTSASGSRYDGYTDIGSGNVYGRDGVSVPAANSGDGGAAGAGGVQGNKHTETSEETTYAYNGTPYTETITSTVIDNQPGEGEAGTAGASGCVAIWYDI